MTYTEYEIIELDSGHDTSRFRHMLRLSGKLARDR